MNEKEMYGTLYDVYSGILKNNDEFQAGVQSEIKYEFDCPEYAELREKYRLSEIAGEGSDFERALRLLHHFAPKLKHMSNYDNRVECNALALLDYCYDKQDVGINCLNKSKILEECCLALGIYARRVGILPYSPYDCDNHVVTEIFDRELYKWIMLDCTTDGYYIDKNGTPLSCFEMREKIGEQETCSILYPGQKQEDVNALFEENLEDNAYYAKNMFYISMDEYSTFGRKGGWLFFAPEHFDIARNRVNSSLYKVKYAEKLGLGENIIEELRKMAAAPQAECVISDAAGIWEAPAGI